MKPLTLEQLIGAPLRALVMGQEAAARATVDFVSEVGFETGADKNPAIRLLEFDYSHPMPDPSNPGGIIDTPVRLRVPLLTMLPVPNLCISEATVTFGANIVETKPVRRLRPPIVLDHNVDDPDTAPAQLVGVYAPAVSPPGQPAPTFSVSIKVTKEDQAEGLSRILHVLSEAITSVSKPR